MSIVPSSREGLEEAVVADDVDQPRDAARVAVDQRDRVGPEDLAVPAPRDLETVADVGGVGVRAHRAQAEAQRHPLLERLVEGEGLVEALQPEKDEGHELVRGQLQVEQPAELLHELARLQHLGLVDEHHRLAPLLLDREEAVVDRRERLDLVLGDRLDAELRGDLAQQPLRRDGGVHHHEEGGLELALVQLVEEAAGERRLSGADVADEDREPHVRWAACLSRRSASACWLLLK